MRPTLSDKAGLMKIEVSQANPMSVQPLTSPRMSSLEYASFPCICSLLLLSPFRIYPLLNSVCSFSANVLSCVLCLSVCPLSPLRVCIFPCMCFVVYALSPFLAFQG